MSESEGSRAFAGCLLFVILMILGMLFIYGGMMWVEDYFIFLEGHEYASGHN